MSRWRHWVLLLVTTVGLAGTLFMAQVILAHHTPRLDLTPEKRYTLSDHARKVLDSLEHDVQIIAFLRSDDARNSEIEDLLARVANVSRRVHYSVVDVNRNPAVARQYGVENYGSLVVESDGHRKDFTNPREDLLMEAILQVTRPTRKIIYVLNGHGEQDIENTDRHHGYSAVRVALQSEFYEVRLLNLLGEEDVPADATALIIAGPRKDLLTAELMKLNAYVGRGGDLLVLVDPGTAPGLTAFLDRYGVKLSDDVVVDPENRLFAGDYLTMTIPGLSERHPVSAVLKAPPLFSQARSVVFAGPPDTRIKGIEFLHSAASSWSTTDLDVLRTGIADFQKGRDRPGPVPVGVSVLVETGGSEKAMARFIVLGDSDFANNFFIEYLGDKDLLVNAVNWLAGQEELVGERPQLRQPGVNQFFVSARQGRLAFTLGTIVEPLLMLLIGTAVFLRRRWTG